MSNKKKIKCVIRATSTLRKLCQLVKRIWIIQGGQGAGKTFAILQLLINHALSNPNRSIYVASAERTKLTETAIKDFIFIMKDFGLYKQDEFKNQTKYQFSNGSFIRFMGLDKEDIGKGLRSDVLFINECDKVKYSSARELMARAKKVILDYNPNSEFWVHSHMLQRPDAEFLKVTFLDNEFIPENEKAELLMYKELGYNEDGTEKNAFYANAWRVYGLGEIGRSVGAILQNWKIGTRPDHLPTAYGLDFGSRDPDAMVEVAIDEQNKKIYVEEVVYQNSMSTNELAEVIKSRVKGNSLIIADSASPRTIQDLYRAGLNIKAVSKNKILDDVKLLQGYELIIHEDSMNLQRELSNWVWLDKRGEVPIDKDNHLIDAMRYIVQTLVKPKAKPVKILSGR